MDNRYGSHFQNDGMGGNQPELMILLGRIDGKLDSALERLAKYEHSHDNLADRVYSLESTRSTNVGARKGILIGISLGSGVSGAALMEVITRFLQIPILPGG